jgi:hypothetical protein
MCKWVLAALLALPLAVAGGLLFARAVGGAAYVCPLTGEELPCPACCPLNDGR